MTDYSGFSNGDFISVIKQKDRTIAILEKELEMRIAELDLYAAQLKMREKRIEQLENPEESWLDKWSRDA